MEVIVDRIENDYIVVETIDKEIYNIPLGLIPDVEEGDIIKIIVDKDEKKLRKEKINNLMNDIFLD